jgi:hypothetical protein
LLRAPQALTLSRFDAVLSGGINLSVNVSFRHGHDACAAGTVVTTIPIAISITNVGTSFQSPAIRVDHWLWLEVTGTAWLLWLQCPDQVPIVRQFPHLGMP